MNRVGFLLPVLLLPLLGSGFLGGYDLIRFPVACAALVVWLIPVAVRFRRDGFLEVRGRTVLAVAAAGALWSLLLIGSGIDLLNTWKTEILSILSVGILAGILAEKDRRVTGEWIPLGVVSVAALVALVGLVQSAGGSMAASTLENTNPAGAVGSICLPLALGLAADHRGRLRIALLAGAALLVAFVMATGSRSSWIALIPSVILGGVILIGRFRSIGMAKLAAGAVVLLVAGGVGATMTARTSWLDRVAGLFDTTSRTRMNRMEIWGSSVRMAADAPIIGVGPGNFEATFPKYRTQRGFELTQARMGPKVLRGVENAHNSYLQLAAEQGVPGLLLLLALFVPAFRRVRLADTADRWTRYGAATGVLAWAVAAFFHAHLTLVAPTVLLWLMLGIWLTGSGAEGRLGKLPVLGGACVLGLSILAGLWIGVGNLRAHHYLSDPDPAGLLSNSEAAVRACPWSVRALTRKASILHVMRRHEEAAEAFSRALRYHPNHAALYVGRGNARLVSGDRRGALEDLRRAREIAPGWAAGALEMARYHGSGGEPDQALKMLDESIRLRDDDPSAHFLRGRVLIDLGRWREARAAFARCEALGMNWRRRLPPNLANDPRLR